MSQLDIFSLPRHDSIGELPRAVIPIKPEIEEAIAELKSLKEFAADHSQNQSVLVGGCTVRSHLFFKGKTAKVINLYQIASVTMATVELEAQGCLIKFPCGASSLEVVT